MEAFAALKRAPKSLDFELESLIIIGNCRKSSFSGLFLSLKSLDSDPEKLDFELEKLELELEKLDFELEKLDFWA